MSAPAPNHVYRVLHVDEVVDYRTLKVGIDLGFRCGTTTDVTVAGIKAIGGESEAADEKRERAREALEEAVRHGDLIIESKKSGDDFTGTIFVDGKPLNL